jgi:hypothetical protein
MKTPNQIERDLAKAADYVLELLSNDAVGYEMQLNLAHQVFKNTASQWELKNAPSLFSGNISKLQKDEKTTLGLALLPAKHSNIANVCAFADSCAESCVAFSGNGSFPSVYRSRMAKTALLTASPKSFMILLIDELFTAVGKVGAQNLAIRLNTYSDIRWERVAPWMFEMFKGVQFYDYTKHPVSSRPETTRPANYHWTYSVSEKTTANHVSECADIGRPLAVVVEVRSGKQPKTEHMRPIPKTWAGMPTVDGDSSDARYLTPTGSVVILRRKHTMKTNHPMITTAQQLEKGNQP